MATKPTYPIRWADVSAIYREPIDPGLRDVGFPPGTPIPAGENNTLFNQRGGWISYCVDAIDEINAFDFRTWTCPDDSAFRAEWDGPTGTDGNLNFTVATLNVVGDVVVTGDFGGVGAVVWAGPATFTGDAGVGDLDFVDVGGSVELREFFQVFPVQSAVFVGGVADAVGQSDGSIKATTGDAAASVPEVVIPLGSLNAVVSDDSEAFMTDGAGNPRYPEIWVEGAETIGVSTDTIKVDLEAVDKDGASVVLAELTANVGSLDGASPGWVELFDTDAGPPSIPPADAKIPSGCALRLRVFRGGFTGVSVTIGAVRVRYATSKVR